MPSPVGPPATSPPLAPVAVALGLALCLVLTLAPTASTTASTAASTVGASARSSAVDGRPVIGATGIGDAYFPLDGNAGYDVTRYDVHVRWDFQRRRLRGWTLVTARATRDLAAFHLDLLLQATRVRVDGRPAAFRRLAAAGGGASHELRVRPARIVPAGSTFRVAVRYAGRPGELGYRGVRNLRATPGEVIAVDEPHIAPWWFPSSDHPSDKARVAVHVTVPRGFQALSGGELRAVTGSGRSRTWHWRSREPMAPYLAFFAAGHFQLERGREAGRPYVRAVSRRLAPPQRAAAMGLLRRTHAVVTWLSRRLGPYPFAATGGVVTGLDTGFALETQTRPVYPAVSGADIDLLVHEQGHQWFGDAVSVRRWRDIWLNEGFATWLEQHWVETHGGPPARTWLRQWYDELRRDAAFWRLPVGDPGPGHLFDWEVYQRGGMAVQALRQRLGDPVFWTVVRTWLRERSGGNGSIADFARLAEEVSGEELDAFFAAWLRGRRAPADVAANGLGR